MRNRVKKFIAAGAATATLIGITISVSPADMASVEAAGAEGRLQSRGRIQYEQAIIDAADLQNINAYITEKKAAATGVLLQLGTKFRQESGGFIIDRNPDASQGDVDLSAPGWPIIVQAVSESQKVPEGLSVLNPEKAMHIEGVEEYTDYYVPAVEDNISRGKAAWMDGRFVIGNGADNDKAYQRGVRDGEDGIIPDIIDPLYSVSEASVEIRHVHIGEQEKKEGISGCYENHCETTTSQKACGAVLIKTDATWYPNPEEEGGGSWHGGYYTCSRHGGVYESPGTCPYKSTVKEWKHDIVCGLEDALYARLSVRRKDTDNNNGTVILEAVMEQGDAYEHLIWTGDDQLTWLNEEGAPLGTGTELTVSEPGTYQCHLNVENEDIDTSSVSVTVKISGILLKN